MDAFVFDVVSDQSLPTEIIMLRYGSNLVLFLFLISDYLLLY